MLEILEILCTSGSVITTLLAFFVARKESTKYATNAVTCYLSAEGLYIHWIVTQDRRFAVIALCAAGLGIICSVISLTYTDDA